MQLHLLRSLWTSSDDGRADSALKIADKHLTETSNIERSKAASGGFGVKTRRMMLNMMPHNLEICYY